MNRYLACGIFLITTPVVFLAVANAQSVPVPPPPMPKPVKPTPQPFPPPPAIQQPSLSKSMPKLEAIADTKLVMYGLALPNYKSLDRMLREPAKDDQAWFFARGQALLIAETANLLMLRPPRNQGEMVWFDRAMELRTKASQLAKSLEAKDFNVSRTDFVNLTNTCNKCHQSFRIPVQIEPFADAKDAK